MQSTEQKITLCFKCPNCGKAHLLDVSREELDLINSDKCIQDAVPNMSATDREKIISGLCEDCQKEIFGE